MRPPSGFLTSIRRFRATYRLNLRSAGFFVACALVYFGFSAWSVPLARIFLGHIILWAVSRPVEKGRT